MVVSGPKIAFFCKVENDATASVCKEHELVTLTLVVHLRCLLCSSCSSFDVSACGMLWCSDSQSFVFARTRILFFTNLLFARALREKRDQNSI